MSSFLPREWGEAGALRVSDLFERPAPKRKGANRIQDWVREEFGDKDVAGNRRARELREENLRRADASRHVRPARVS
jgi:hypothetical protein